jgi:acyl dehydratase
MFNVVMTWLPLLTALTDAQLNADLMRLLHRAQEMRFFAPIRPGDRISAAATITAIETAPTGETITVQLDASNQRQEVVSRTRFAALIRGRRDRVMPADSSAAADRISRPAPLLAISQRIAPDQAIRYAEASGDRNPIHLDETVAKMVGLPGVIVQGLCTMAFTSRVIVEHCCDGAPERLRYLAVKFSRPVFPCDVITTSIWSENVHNVGVHQADTSHSMRFSFETCNQAGVAVIEQGVAEIDKTPR